MNTRQIKKGLDAIALKDRHVAKALEAYGYPKTRIQPSGFETFLTTIVSQQISVKAAASILGRVKALLPAIDAPSLLTVPDAELRAAGLSARKMEYLQGLARAIVSGEFSPEVLNEMDDDSAIESITRLRGFGRWSAEIYLMFSLGRPDIFPADDLILLTTLQKLKKTQNPADAEGRPRESRALGAVAQRGQSVSVALPPQYVAEEIVLEGIIKIRIPLSARRKNFQNIIEAAVIRRMPY